MKYPICPNCNNKISFIQGLKFLNPWKIKCPHCETYIQANRLYKVLTVIAPFFGFAIAGVAIYFEETEKWETNDSLLYFFIIFSILSLIAYKTWPYVKFLSKTDEK